MSAHCTGWVYCYSPARGAAFSVHLAAADSANDQHDYELWMRQAKLATKARVSRKAAGEALAWLCDQGLLVLLESGAARGSANRYRFLMPDLPAVWTPGGVTPGGTPDATGGVTSGGRGATRGRRGTTPGGTGVPPQVAHNPISNPSGNPSPTQPAARGAAAELVTAWWEERKAAGNPVGQPFIACTKVVASMLGQGVAANRIEWALRAAPVCSTGALEFAIQHRLAKGGKGDPVALAAEVREQLLRQEAGQ